MNAELIQIAKVLIVEDHPELAYSVKLLLQQCPLIASVDIALCGEEALKVADRLQPSVVVMDLHLPDMPGIEVARRLRSQCRSHIVVYTGDENWTRYLDDFMEIQISGMVHKREMSGTLQRTVEGVLNGHVSHEWKEANHGESMMPVSESRH